MNFLLALVASIFGKVGEYLVVRLGAQLAIRTAVITAWVAGLTVFTVAINAAIMAIAVSVPAVISSALSCLPSNTGPCIGAIGASYAAAWVYTQVTSIATVKGRI